MHEAENAFPRDSERDRTRTQTRSHEEANAFTRGAGGKRVCTRQRTRFRGAENAIAPYARVVSRSRLAYPHPHARAGLRVWLRETTARLIPCSHRVPVTWTSSLRFGSRPRHRASAGSHYTTQTALAHA